MDALSSRGAITSQDGREVPEEEVVRGGPAMSVPMQVREAVTKYVGARPRRGAATPAPGQVFETREAVTITLPSPRWAAVEQRAKENDHANVSSTDADRGQD